MAPAQAGPTGRLLAIDWMRGLVMVLMALDHSSESLNAGRLFTDGAFVYHPGTPLPAAQFLTRWVTHLCAPTFVFLAGASLALQIDRRTSAGESAWTIDRDLVSRGIVIAALEIGVMLLCLAAFTLAEARLSRREAREGGLLTVLGRTPMFFYLLHIPCLVLAARALKVENRLGLGWTYFGAAAVVALLYPLCRRYGRYKAAHPRGWPRYI